MFAGSCIGVILLVMSLEFLRRAGKEYDRYILRQAEQQHQPASVQANANHGSNVAHKDLTSSSIIAAQPLLTPRFRQFRPSILQQTVRAVLHMVQFGVAYFIMLLAMYYNGYFIISIMVGAFIGSFIFSWETIDTRYVD